jgi:hypothetical protein
MQHEPVSQRFFYRWETWPQGQSVQPGDDPPVLRSVDENDPVGRLAPKCETTNDTRAAKRPEKGD